MYCAETGCYNDAHRVIIRNDIERFICDDCFLRSRRSSKSQKITVEFCMWLQDTEVFDMFVNHLNKGLKVEMVKKAKGGV